MNLYVLKFIELHAKRSLLIPDNWEIYYFTLG